MTATAVFAIITVPVYAGTHGDVKVSTGVPEIQGAIRRFRAALKSELKYKR